MRAVYSQDEISRWFARRSAALREYRVPCPCGDGSCMLCDDTGMRRVDPTPLP